MLLPRIDCNYAFSRMLKEFTNCHPSFADMSHIRILKRVDSNIKLPCFCAGNKLYFDRIFMYFEITFVSCLLYNIINDYVYGIIIMMARYYGGVGIAVSREEDLRRERAREREERDKMVRDYIR